MKYPWIRNVAIAAAIMTCAAGTGAPAMAEAGQSIPATQFERIAALTGEWKARESTSLRIVFESTAGGSVIVERWMVGERMHSLTVYHLDGESLIATHYCPQGNQPRLSATAADEAGVSFTFLDATDLDPHESFQHDLSFEWNADGTVLRAETYRGPEGAGEESSLVLFPATD